MTTLHYTKDKNLQQTTYPFLEGFIRTFTILGAKPEIRCPSSSPEDITFALRGDWEAVGYGLRHSMLKHEELHGLDILEQCEESMGITKD